MKCKCIRCQSESSVFWWPYSVGCNSEGKNPNDVFYLCDLCQVDFVKFVRGCAVNENVKVLRRNYATPEEHDKEAGL